MESNDYFGPAIIDIDEWREKPIKHRFLHGSFKGTHTKFILCFPESKNYDGRFIQHLQGGLGGNEYTGYLAGGLYLARRNKSYYIESNQGHTGDLKVLRDHLSVFDWGASAATALYARKFAMELYGEEPHHGFLYGGSGGGYRCVKCAEAPVEMWDGFMPMIMSYPAFFTYNDSIKVLTVLLLDKKLKDVLNATDPGGTGNPFSVLDNSLQKEVLARLYRSGFPRGAEDQLKPDPFWPYSMQIVPDRKYWETFWKTPGFEGTDNDPIVRSLLIEETVEVKEVLNLIELRSSIKDEILDEDLIKDVRLPKEAKVGIKVKCKKPGRYLGCLMQLPNGNKVFSTHNFGDILVNLFTGIKSEDIKPGDKIYIDNRRLIAFCFHHRHFISNHYPEMKHLFIDGNPIYTPTKYSIDRIPMPSGKFKGKMILLQNAQDCDAGPNNARAYIKSVKNHLHKSLDNYFRIYWSENACHIQPLTPPESTKYIRWGSIASQAMNDLIKWVEQDIPPPPSTNYNFDIHSALRLPVNASDRRGIQPTVQLNILGKKSVQVTVNQQVDFDGVAETPPETGCFIRLEWDFDGTGSFEYKEELIGTENKIRVTSSHKYDRPGIYYTTFRVTVDRNGDKKDIIHHITNQSRVRVIVI